MKERIENGIKFLKEHQKKDGSFLSFTSTDPVRFKDATKCESVFSTALIMSCLKTLTNDNQSLGDIKSKSAEFLLLQKSEHWSFNYWTRGSTQSKQMPYPDDLDDTSCVLSALYEYNPLLIDGEVMAGVVSVLTALESSEGGPYRTWLVPPSAADGWLDVDLAVNSNIAYFLSLQGVELKNIVEFVESAIENANYTSPYYPTVYPVIYFISRFYKGNKIQTIIDFLLKKQKNNNWGNPLDTALAILALCNFGVRINELKAAIGYIRSTQGNDGSWGAVPFYIGINPKQKHGDKNKYYAGSSSLTTAFCISALSVAQPSEVETDQFTENEKDESSIYEKVTQRFAEILPRFGAELRMCAEAQLAKTIKGDRDRLIVLLPYFFAKSLEQKNTRLDARKVVDLGLANLHGWVAYTIYDDFLDDEGDPQMLSLANVSMRESYKIFSEVLPNVKFQEFVTSIFDRIDSANAWEVTNCRVKDKTIAAALVYPVPDFSDIANLADRSLGHALGLVCVLSLSGHNPNSVECRTVLEGMRSYIAAKQIHDDMHDWEEDLGRGQINSASAAIFSSIKNKELVPVDEAEALKFLQQKFWDETVVGLCGIADVHIAEAKKLLLSVGSSSSFVDRLMDPIRETNKITMSERSNTKKFIAKYTDNK